MSIALTLPLLLAVPAPAAAPLPTAVDQVDDALAAAGKDVAALVALAEGWTAEGNEAAARRGWERVLELDSEHEGAHGALRHHRWGGHWYTTYAALSAARRAEQQRRLAEEGLVLLGDAWVPVAEAPFRRMGWEQQPDGSFAPPGTRAAREEREALLAAGHQLQHLTPIPPEEFDQWRAGLWKVGDTWLDTAAANAAHAELDAWWRVPSQHFVALATVPEEHTRWVAFWADQVHLDLAEIFGLAPAAPPEFLCLHSIAQYNTFAAGDAATGRVPADAQGFSSLHYAFLADAWVEMVGDVPVPRVTGVAWYDPTDPALAPYGQHAVRHAAALAWLETVDPSWDTVARMATAPTAGFPDGAFWAEKRIPRWLHYGAAAYCERFFEDRNVPEGGDPQWARTWALANLTAGGDLAPVEEVLALELSTSDPAASLRLVHQAGLLLHYTLHGGDARVTKAFDAYRDALRARDDVAEPLAAYEEALVRSAKKIEGFAKG